MRADTKQFIMSGSNFFWERYSVGVRVKFLNRESRTSSLSNIYTHKKQTKKLDDMMLAVDH